MNDEGETVARYQYDAWGCCTTTTIPENTVDDIAHVNPYRYRSYYYDAETNLYYLQSRYYDPNTGRFINADLPDYVYLSGTNLFAYCNNCPTNRVDYYGYCDEPISPPSETLGSYSNDVIVLDYKTAYKYNTSNTTMSRYNFWLSDLAEKFIPNIYTNDIAKLYVFEPIQFLGIRVEMFLSYALQTNANAIFGWMMDGKTIEVSGFLGISDQLSFSMSFGITWTETYMKFGLMFSPQKSGKFFAISLQISVSHITVAAIATLCALVPALGTFITSAFTAIKSSITVAAPLLLPIIPKLIPQLI